MDEQVTQDALKIHNLQINTGGIERKGNEGIGYTTVIEGATSFDKNGMKVGNNVTINKDGSMEARNGDANFYFNKDNISLNNGNNSVMVGNNTITLNAAGTELEMTKDGLNYADGKFQVDADGSVRIARNTENSITLDASTGVIYANDFSTGEYSLNSIGEQLKNLETGDISDLKRKTAGIERDNEITTIEGVASFSKDGMKVDAGNSYVSVTDDSIVMNNNGKGMVINNDGVSLTSGMHNVNVTKFGTEFFNGEDGRKTVINGGAITADTLNLADLDEDVATEINNLKDTMGTVGGDVADLRTDVNQNTYDIGVLRTDVGDLRNDVGTLRVDVESLNKRLEVVEDKTQNINGDNTYGPGEQPSGSGDVHEGGNTDFTGNINSDSVTTGEITADKGTIGGVTMEDGSLTADKATIGDVTVGGSLNVADKVTADKDGVTVKGDGENNVKIDGNDVSVSWKDDEGNSNETSIRDNYEAINDLDNRVTGEVNRLDSRIDKVEDRIDKVGAMAAAIANLRTMGYDPAAPTEIAVGIGQYRSETGAALGLFHYPNRDFMLSLSVSTSGDEVMGGIGATWKFGRKTPEQMLAAEKEKAAKAKLAKAEAMKKAAAEAKVAAQQAKHAKMAAEKAAK